MSRDAAVRALPDFARPLLDGVLALADAGRTDAALSALMQAEAQAPGNAAIALWSAHFHRQQRRPAESLAAARRAVALSPDDADALCALGLARIDQGDVVAGRRLLEQAVARDPACTAAHNALGLLAERERRHDDAEAHWIAAIEADPAETAPLRNLALMLQATGRGDEACALLAPAVEALPDDVGLQWTMAIVANYAPQLTAEAVAEQHRRHGRALRAVLPPVDLDVPLAAPAPWPGRPLRVGFLSPDFREHPVAWFLLPLLRHLDPSRVQAFAYMDSRHADDVTERFRAAVPAFAECGHLTDANLVRRVRSDRLDLLVECAGLFAGARPVALAHRMAPLQITWLGYPNTTGLPNVDVRLVDARTDPPGAEALATERLHRMDGPFLCWHAGDDVPLPARDPTRPLTFGCFNNVAKLHAGLLAAWARLLAAVPGSRLLLKASAFGAEDVRRPVREELAALGAAPDRVEIRGGTRDRASHLATYGEVDIALDTFPYNGTTTTCEALWMGTPVVALAGRGHPGRVGLSILTAMGRADWVADGPEAYIAIAAAMGADRARLAAIQRGLRARMKASALCDAAGFAGDFTAALETLQRDRLSGAVAPRAAPARP